MSPDLNSSVQWDDLPQFCSASEVAALLHISRATAYRMADMGQIPSVRVGRRVIFSREHLKAWIDKSIGGEAQNGATYKG